MTTDMSGAHVVITGGAGFLGAHLSRALIGRSAEVTVIDNFSTGHRASLSELDGRARFAVRDGDITQPGCPPPGNSPSTKGVACKANSPACRCAPEHPLPVWFSGYR